MAEVIHAENRHPILIDRDGFLYRDPTRYLIERTQVNSDTLDYINQISGKLSEFFSFLEEKAKSLYQATTTDICDFRDLQKNRLLPETVNQKIIAIVAFYWWAQTEGLCRNVVGWNDFNRKNVNYQITVHKPPASSKGPKYKLPFLLSETNTGRTKTPSQEDIRGLRLAMSASTMKARGSAAKVREQLDIRNQLMISWMIEGGLRRREAVSLRLSCLPDISASQNGMVDVLLQHGTKYKKKRTIEVRAGLIQDTLDFIEMERDDLLKNVKVDPGVIFCSATGTGKLSRQTITNLLGNFKEVALSPHDLRSFGLSQYANHCYRLERRLVSQGDKRTVDELYIEWKLKQQAGHESLSTTLKHYVKLAAINTLDDSNYEDLEAYAVDLETQLAMVRGQLKSREDSQKRF